MSGSPAEREDAAADDFDARDGSKKDDRLNEVIGAYLAAKESGGTPDREEILRAHPELAPELEKFFESEDRFDNAQADLRSIARRFDPCLAGGVFGDYVIIGAIARGGMGVVYKARQTSLNRLVALKVILGGALADPALLRRFRVEAEAAASLDHPHIVPVYDFGEQSGCCYLSMRLIEGESLAERLRRSALPAVESARLVVLLARAIQHAHERGVLHRDLKPANVLISADGTPHVTDFGLARFLEADGTLTSAGGLVGTPGYMAPEQVGAGVKGLTTAADVYGLGAILYELLAGRPPFEGNTLGTVQHVLADDPVSLRRQGFHVPRDLETICLKCLRKDPRQRYESARALADDLGLFLRGEPVTARPLTPLDLCVRSARRRPAAAALVVVSVLAVVTLLVVGALYNRSLSQALRREHELTAVSRRNLYADRLTRAWEDWGRGRWARARGLLDEYTPRAEEDLRGFGWRHLLRRLDAARHVLVGESSLGDVAFSPSEDVVVTADDGGRVNQWNVRTGESGVSRYRLGGAALAVSFSPDGTLLAMGGHKDHAVVVLEMRSDDVYRRLEGHTESVQTAAFSPDGTLFATAGDDRTVRFWDFESGRELLRLETRSSVYSIAFSRDGKRIAVGEEHSGVSVWTTSDGERLRDLELGFPVRAVSFSPDGATLAAGNNAGEIRTWDATTLVELATVEAHALSVEDLAFSPDGKSLASCGRDSMLRLWDARELAARVTCMADDGALIAVDYSRDGALLVTAGENGDARLWDVRTLDEPESIAGHPKAVWDLGIRPEGNRFVTGDDDYRYILWELVDDGNPRTEQRAVFLAPGREEWTYGSLAPDGTRIVAARRDGTVTVLRLDWDESGGQLIEEAALAGDGAVSGAEFSSDSRTLAVAMNDRVKCWQRVATQGGSQWKELSELTAGVQKLKTLSFAPDKSLLAVGSRGSKIVEVWDLASRRLQSVLPNDVAVTDLCFCPVAHLLAAGCDDGTVVIYRRSAAGGEFEEWIRLRGHDASVEGMLFLADARRIVTAGDDRTVRLWDLVVTSEGDMGIDRATLRGAREPIKVLAFAARGDVLVTAGGRTEGEVRVWRTAGTE